MYQKGFHGRRRGDGRRTMTDVVNYALDNTFQDVRKFCFSDLDVM